ncbi:tyrosine-protein kinase BAZ1B-like [Tubulanus polymorphus]|uniref:tyrosine-protein kinase BAZ1B-like n=1 Tax=Tubulanus polymorphus TaxID=672921 RepID=UPI003DA39443
MPLLRQKYFSPARPITNIDENETVYTIPHSKEQFKTKDEYTKRMSLYSERVWTCQCTGHVNLTHEQAFLSEMTARKSLKSQFPSCFEKPVLEIIHHTTDSLDLLVDKAWTCLHQAYLVGEEVIFKVKTNGKSIIGHVTDVDKCGVVDAPKVTNCHSPSSDKENSTNENNNATTSEGSPKKWTIPQLLSYKYSVKINGEDKIIHGVPAADICRTARAPSKELLRLFIRANAVRYGVGSSSPWVVDEAYVKKYSIPNKFADFMVSPQKMMELTRKAQDDMLKKRKNPPSKLAQPASKKLKSEKSVKLSAGKSSSSSGKKQKTLLDHPKKSPMKKSNKSSEKTVVKSKKSASAESRVNSSDSEDDMLLATIKSKSSSADVDSSDSDIRLLDLKIKLTPVKVTKMTTASASTTVGPADDSDSSEDVVLAKVKSLTPKKKLSSKSHSSPSKKNKSKTDAKSPKKKKKEDKANSTKKKTPKKQPAPNQKKGMKQITLLDMSKQLSTGSPKASPSKLKTPTKARKSPVKPVTPRTPLIVKRIQKTMLMDERKRKHTLPQLLTKACNDLTEKQRGNLPLDVRDMILKKYEKIAEAKKLKSMSVEERDAYLAAKRAERKEEQKKLRLAQRKRFEDNELDDLRALPAPKIVSTPDGLPNECFGDVVMVTEFIGCFKELLTPDSNDVIRADSLMEALVAGPRGFWYITKVLVYLLQTLLQDQIAEDYAEFGIELSEVPVNSFTASELVRLCLRTHDHTSDENNRENTSVSSEQELEDEVDEEIIDLLEGSEFFALDPTQKLSILVGLCNRIMASYSLQDYIEEKQKLATSLWRERLNELHKKNIREKEMKKEGKKVPKTEENPPNGAASNTNSTTNTLLSHFYGKNSIANDSKPTSSADEGGASANEANDLASIVKRRRLNAALREQQSREEKKRKDKEYEEYKQAVALQKLEKDFEEGILKSKLTLRQVPIGHDRHHNRYWVFSKSSLPGLFVEKGWAAKEIDYRVEMSDVEQSGSDSEDEDKKPLERTFPHRGQNLWFHFDGMADMEQLLDNLHPRGIRESLLKKELQTQLPNIAKSFEKKLEPDLLDADGPNDIRDAFKKELKETRTRLVNGCMGGDENYDAWVIRLDSTTNIKDLAALLLETHLSVDSKFLEGIFTQTDKVEKSGESGTGAAVEGSIVKNKKLADRLKSWIEAVESSATFSRLHVLLGMLDASIMWEKSAEHAKCKICRRNRKDDYTALILCDSCNQAFHLMCLRPALLTIPDGDWFCPACTPRAPRQRDRPKHYVDRGSSNDGTSEEEKMEVEEPEYSNEENCTRCGGDEGLVSCSSCPRAFHLDCHIPALRHEPRKGWSCQYCKEGIPYKKKRSQASRSTRSSRSSNQRTAAAAAKTRRRAVSSSDEDEDFSENDRSKKSKRGRPRRSTRGRRVDYVYESENDEVSGDDDVDADGDDDDDDDEETEIEENVEPVESRSHRRTKRSNSPKRPTRNSSRPVSQRRQSDNSDILISNTSKTQSELQAIYYEIVGRLVKNRACWPFCEPVDRDEVPDYFEIVRNPIDLSTIETKCFHYETINEFIADFILLFNNAELYNKPNSEVYKCMVTIEKHFGQLIERFLPEVKYKRKFVGL